MLIIFLIIKKGKECDYLAVEKLLALLIGITSKPNGDFYCLSCLRYFRTKNKLESLKKVCGNEDIFTIVIHSEETKILEFNQ